MSYNLERVKKEFTDACNKAGVNVSVPIALNNRLTSTLGRVLMKKINAGSPYQNISVEFSKKFIECGTDTDIHETILHEAAHFIVCDRTGECHGHDNYFKEVCAEIGCSGNQANTNHEVYKPNDNKYALYCPNCGFVGGFSRMCKTLKYAGTDMIICNKCKSTKLFYEQNW